METPRRRRVFLFILFTLAAIVVGSYAIVFLIQPSAYEAAAEWAEALSGAWLASAPSGQAYRDTGSGLTQGFQQEFQIKGTDPLMAVWVEVRRPLYAPFWRVADIVEEKVDLDPD